MRALTFFYSCVILLLSIPATSQGQETVPVKEGLILDLNADKDVITEEDNRVAGWRNQVKDSPAQLFVKQDKGREVAGSGRPTLRTGVKAINGHNTLIFRQQELINDHEDAFDALLTGNGYTWLCVMSVYEQRVGLVDVNSFFGNLRNGGNYEGLWGNLNDDNSVWVGSRNGITFGRFDENNPKLSGPHLQTDRYYLVAARMDSGTGTVPIELFVNEPVPVNKVMFPVNVNANPSRLAIGQERDAIEHPGVESFDGEIARFVIYERPLDDDELRRVFAFFKDMYNL